MYVWMGDEKTKNSKNYRSDENHKITQLHITFFCNLTTLQDLKKRDLVNYITYNVKTRDPMGSNECLRNVAFSF